MKTPNISKIWTPEERALLKRVNRALWKARSAEGKRLVGSAFCEETREFIHQEVRKALGRPE